MTVYYCDEIKWEEIEKFWNNEFPEKYKNESVFQLEAFPTEGMEDITFISTEDEAVKLVSEKFKLRINESWTSIGAQGLKRLTGEKSKWVEVPLKKIFEYKPMTKEQLQNALNTLNGFYSEFVPEYRMYKTGKNKKLRERAYTNLKYTIQKTEQYLWKTEEILELLCNGDTSDSGRAIIMDEFRSPDYFNSDMVELIRDVNNKLDNMK